MTETSIQKWGYHGERNEPVTGVVRLNLGCGRNPIPGWINVDVRAGPGVDVHADLDGPGCLGEIARDGSVDEVKALGLLEHLPHYENLVLEVARVLRQGGRFEIRVPYRMDYVAYHVRHFDKGTFNPWRSDYAPRELDLVRRPHSYGSLEFSAPYFTEEEKWVQHWIPFSWHVQKYLHLNITKLPLGRRLNLHLILRRNDNPWKP